MDTKHIYVDTDVSLGTPGAEIDDGAALIFLLRNKSIEVIGAGSIFGNVSVDDATLHLDRLMTWLGAEHINLGKGAEKPLTTDMSWFKEWESRYGQSLPWTLRVMNISAAELIVKTICAQPNQVSILALGPMTNLALALQLESTITSLTHEVIVMGGSLSSQNASPEFNIHCDPEAAQIVLNAGWKVHILGLDITRRVHFSLADFAALPDGNPAVDLLRMQAPGWIDRMEEMGWEHDGCALHDAVAAAYLVDRSMFQTEQASVQVELSNSGLRGMTRFSVPQEDKPIITAVTNVDTEKCREFIWSYLNQ